MVSARRCALRTIDTVAACTDGIEPVDDVNEAMSRIRVPARLGHVASLTLVSSLVPRMVARTVLGCARSGRDFIDQLGDVLAILSQLLCEAHS